MRGGLKSLSVINKEGSQEGKWTCSTEKLRQTGAFEDKWNPQRQTANHLFLSLYLTSVTQMATDRAGADFCGAVYMPGSALREHEGAALAAPP